MDRRLIFIRYSHYIYIGIFIMADKKIKWTIIAEQPLMKTMGRKSLTKWRHCRRQAHLAEPIGCRTCLMNCSVDFMLALRANSYHFGHGQIRIHGASVSSKSTTNSCLNLHVVGILSHAASVQMPRPPATRSHGQ